MHPVYVTWHHRQLGTTRTSHQILWIDGFPCMGSKLLRAKECNISMDLYEVSVLLRMCRRIAMCKWKRDERERGNSSLS